MGRQTNQFSLLQYLSACFVLMGISIRLLLGRRFYLIPLLTLIWPLFQAVRLMLGWQQQNFNEADVQNILIGFPVYILALGTGVRIVANEIEKRTLEVNYMLPGGAKNVWIFKLLALGTLLLCTELILASVVSLFFTPFSPVILIKVFQGGFFFLVVSMGIGALFKHELTATMLSIALLVAVFYTTDSWWSPVFNPLNSEEWLQELASISIKNHIVVIFFTASLLSLSFFRADRREALLRD